MVERIPPPKGDPEAPLAALIFDAHYDAYRGTIINCRVFDGTVKAGDTIRFMFSDSTYRVEEVGWFRLAREKRDELSAGEVGYIIAGIKTVADTRIGDTVTADARPAAQPLPGFKEVKPVVFAKRSRIDFFSRFMLIIWNKDDKIIEHELTICFKSP